MQRGYDRAEVAAALDDLERRGYLSDARYAAERVERHAGHLGRRAIAHDLRRKGVSEPARRQALSALEQRDELADATALWTRRFGRLPVDAREAARQIRYLVSRGYTSEIALRVLRAARALENGTDDGR